MPKSSVSLFILAVCLCYTSQLKAQRIVSLGPNITEIVCELELCDHLAGVTEFCHFPAYVERLPKVGGYIDPNLEVILGMKPDLILALPEHQNATVKLKKLGLRVETIRNWDIADIYQSIKKIGALTGKEESAGNLVDNLKARQAELTRERDRPPKCLMALGHEIGGDVIKEVYIVGNNGFLNELLTLAGGENVYKKDTPHYPKLSQEALIALDPDIIIDLVPQRNLSVEERYRKLKAWQSVPHLSAVKEQRCFILHSEHILQAGPRFLETLSAMNKALDTYD